MRPGGAHLIAALLLAHLAVPAELLQPLGLDAVGDGLGAEEIRLPHGARGPPPSSAPSRKSPPEVAENHTGSHRGAAGSCLPWALRACAVRRR